MIKATQFMFRCNLEEILDSPTFTVMYGPFMLITRLSCTITSRPWVAGTGFCDFYFSFIFVCFCFCLFYFCNSFPAWLACIIVLVPRVRMALTLPNLHWWACPHVLFCPPVPSSSHQLSSTKSDTKMSRYTDTRIHTSRPHHISNQHQHFTVHPGL